MTRLEEFQELLERSRYREALHLVDQALQSNDPDEPFERMAAALRNRAESSHDATNAIYEAMYRAAIDLQRRAHGEDSEAVWTAWWCLAAFLDKHADSHAAKGAYRSMIAVAEKLVDSEPALLERALNRYAELIMRQGELAEAELLQRQVIASLEKDWPGREAREGRFGKKGPSLPDALSDLRANLLMQGKADEANDVAARIAEVRSAEDGTDD